MNNKDNKIRKFFRFELYQTSIVEQYLSDMASKGYFLEKISGCIFTFTIDKPAKVNYCVDIFPKASFFDYEPSNKTKEYIEYCERVGWKYICFSGKLLVFCSKELDTLPIHTDNQIALNNVRKSMILNTFLCILQIIAAFGITSILFINLPTILCSYIKIFTLLTWINFFIVYAYNLINYYIWFHKCKKSIEINNEMYKPDYKNACRKKTKSNILILFLVILCLIPLILFCIRFISIKASSILGVIILFTILFHTAYNKISSKKKLSNKYNILVTVLTILVLSISIVATFGYAIIKKELSYTQTIKYTDSEGNLCYSLLGNEKIPIYLSDLAYNSTGYDETYADSDETFMAECTQYTDTLYKDISSDDSVTLSYTVYRTNFSAINKIYIKYQLSKHSYDLTTIDGITASNIYTASDNDSYYLLLEFEHCVLLINSPTKLSKDNVQLFIDRLNIDN